MSHCRTRVGFTLIELLVVTALFLAFFSLIAAGMRPNSASQVRRLAQDLSSAVLAAQTRSLSSESGVGLTIVPGALVTSQTTVITGTTVFNAQSPPFIRGTVSGLTATPSSLTAALAPTNAPASELANGYAVQLTGSGGNAMTPWLLFTPPSTIAFDNALNQTMHNTIFPTGGASNFVVDRLPTTTTIAVMAPRFAAIDLRYSGVGMVTADPFGTLSTSGTVSLIFDRNGCLSRLSRTGTTPAVLTAPAPLYLLIASTTDIAANTSLSSPRSWWIAIAPDSGRVSSAMNVSVSFSGAPTDSQINVARSNARQAITQGAR